MTGPGAPPALELFSGIGAFACAARGRFRILQAFDQDEEANKVYLANHRAKPCSTNLCSVSTDHLSVPLRPGWFLSPPCQPYSKKGRGRDVDDPRAQALLHLADLVQSARPEFVLLENVPPFASSRACSILTAALEAAGLLVRGVTLCPTELGIPNRRSRFYLLATRSPLPDRPPLRTVGASLASYLDPEPAPALFLDGRFVAEHGSVLDVVDDRGVAACFGASYGKARSRAGSVLAGDHGFRLFSPEEILRLHHFPPGFAFPAEASLRTRYRLAGNSINVAVLGILLDWLRKGLGA